MLEREENDTIDRSLVGQAPFVFDAVWAAARALNKSQQTLLTDGYRLQDFSYDPNTFTARKITEAIYNSSRYLSFSGLSGQVKFTESGERMPQLRFFQYRRKWLIRTEDDNCRHHYIDLLTYKLTSL